MKSTKNIIGIIVVLGLIIWGAFTLASNKKNMERETEIVAKQNDSIAVSTAEVSIQKIKTDYRVNGTFEPFQELHFSSEVPGKVIKILVEEGDEVKVGQTMALIKGDAQSIELSAAQANYENALKDNQRFENALKTGGVSQQQVDGSRLQLKNAKSQLDQAQLQVGDTRVKSSIDGVVNQRMIELGSMVSPGAPMFEIVNISKLKLKVEVNEHQLVNYDKGDEITVKASVYPDKEFTGKISFIASKALASMNFPVHITVDNQGEDRLKAGMYGTAIFSSKEDDSRSKELLVIPRSAFVGGLNNTEVFVLEGHEAKLQKVTIGANFGDLVEIKDGLEEGQQVVTSGQINLTDGATVRIMNK